MQLFYFCEMGNMDRKGKCGGKNASHEAKMFLTQFENVGVASIRMSVY